MIEGNAGAPALIVDSSEPIGLVGAAELPLPVLTDMRGFARSWVAADGGAVHLLAHGLDISAVIGDLDSVAGPDLAAISEDKVHRVAEQDSTDFEKCLMSVRAPLLLAGGFLGGRLDHQLAGFHALVRFAHQRAVLLSEDELVFLCPPHLRLSLPAGAPVSLFPMAPLRADAGGLKWSFDGLALAPGGRIGTSNEATGGAFWVRADQPALLCILPRMALPDVVRALMDLDATWPARA